MYLFFDTETTGLVEFKLPHDDDRQPHLVQLGALLTDEDGTDISHCNLVVNPGVEVPEQASKIHGFSTEYVKAHGLPPQVAATAFGYMLTMAELVVAHNIDFDLKVMRAQMARLNLGMETNTTFCTMRTATPIVKAPSKRPDLSRYKWPSLGECYKHFFNEELEGAHDAMVDVRACKRIFFALKRNNEIKAGDEKETAQ